MDERDWLAERFEEHRTHLRAVAYRMLGSLSEADDAVQEAWLRLSRTDTNKVENLGGWLTTVVARVSLNMLRSRRSRQEAPLGVHMPDPIIDRADGTDPEHEALLADSVGLALLVVLETLTPPERIAFVLHDMFAVPFDEIAPIVDRSPDAARQRAARADASRAKTRFPTPTSTRSAGSPTPFWQLRAAATSRPCSRCWTQMSCCGLISAPRPQAHRERSAEPGRSPARRSSTRGSGWS
jgi:RNA polymerase sigma factor (sigma-70 family)